MRLHDYQRYAVRYIEEHPACALILDMGLGKTVITLTAIRDLILDAFSVRRVLVIAPLRVARDTWPAEIAKWPHLHCLSCAAAVGAEKARMAALDADAMVTVINRENVPWLVKSYPWQWDMVVIDELSSFKSHRAQRFKALKAVRPRIKRVVGLTGTPSPNGLEDLWAEFFLIDQGERLGRFVTRFREAYLRPKAMNGHVVFSYEPRPGAEAEIYKKLSDITVSMKAVDNLDMPERRELSTYVELAPAEMAEYRRLRDEYVLPAEGITAANAAALAGKLLQMAGGAVYGDDGAVHEFHSRKLDALEELIEEANGQNVMVAYWFKSDAARIRERIPDARELRSASDMADWNAGRIRVALLHPASAGHGLNLQAGGHLMIWYSLTWSLELYQQANARLWRQGQASGYVAIQHIIARGTLDERIMAVLRGKDRAQAGLVDAVKAEMGR